MFIVKDTQADVPYQASFQVTDAKGDSVPSSAVTVVIVSDNPDAVKLTPDASDPTKGIASFVNPGIANINCTVSLADGTVLGSFGAQFTVTAGDPAKISGGTISFQGLTEAP